MGSMPLSKSLRPMSRIVEALGDSSSFVSCSCASKKVLSITLSLVRRWRSLIFVNMDDILSEDLEIKTQYLSLNPSPSQLGQV